MATKPTKRALKAKVEGLLDLAPLAERYKELEKEIKVDMQRLGLTGPEQAIIIDGKGRVFISESERLTIPVDVATDHLGDEAEKIIQIKKSVSNRLFEAFCDAGVISEARRDAVLEQSKHTPVVSIYVRPLK